MTALTRAAAGLALAAGFLSAAGCGGGGVRVEGQLVKNDQPYRPQGETVTVYFSTGNAGGKASGFSATAREDGTFAVPADSKLVMPPGDYQISVSFAPSDSSNPAKAKEYFSKNAGKKDPVTMKYQVTDESVQRVKVDFGKKSVTKG